MKRNFKLIFLLILMIFSCKMEEASLSILSGNQELSFESGFDFSTMAKGRNEIVLTFKNPLEKSALIINELSIDNNNFYIQTVQAEEFEFPLVLEPQKTLGIVVVFAPTKEGEHEANLLVEITVEKGEEKKLNFPIRSEIFSIGLGEGNSGLMIEENRRSVSFGAIELGGSVTERIVLSNLKEQPLLIESCIVPRPFIVDDSVFPLLLAKGARLALDIKFSPTTIGFDNGFYFATAVIKTADGVLNISLDGVAEEIAGPFLALLNSDGVEFTNEIHFGEVGAGVNGVPLELTIENKGTADLRIFDISFSNIADFSIPETIAFPKVIAPYVKFTFNAQFSPRETSLGIRSGNLIIDSNSSRNKLFAISCRGVGLGKNSPRISVAADSRTISNKATFNYPSMSAGDPAVSASFSIQNIGTADLEIRNIKLISAEGVYTLKNTPELPKILQASDAPVTFDVEFLADNIRLYNGELVIESSDSTKDATFTTNLRAAFVLEKPLLSPSIEFVNEGAIKGSFVGKYDDEGNPKFKFSTPTGSSGNGNFSYKLLQGSTEIESDEVVGSGTEVELSAGEELETGNYILSVRETNDKDVFSTPNEFAFVISRDKPSAPVVGFVEEQNKAYHVDVDGTMGVAGKAYTTDIMPVYKWDAVEGEENIVNSYVYKLTQLAELEENNVVLIDWTETRNSIFSEGRNRFLDNEEYLLEVTAKDGFTQESEITEFYFRVDTIAPVLTLKAIPESSGDVLIIPYGLPHSEIKDFDPGATALDDVFGDCEVVADYSEVSTSTIGDSTKVYYVAEDKLGNKRLGEARRSREVLVVDFSKVKVSAYEDLATKTTKKFITYNDEFDVTFDNAPELDYGHLKYELTIAESANGAEHVAIANMFKNKKVKLIPDDADSQEIEIRNVTGKITINKANPGDDPHVIPITRSFEVFPEIGLKEQNFENGYAAGAWSVDYATNLNWNVWYKKFPLVADEKNGSPELPLFSILEPDTSQDVKVPEGGPAGYTGTNVFKIHDTTYINSNIKEVEARIFQEINIVRGQKYKLTCRALENNNYEDGISQLQVHDEYRKFDWEKQGYIISDLSLTRSKKNQAGQWVVYEAEFRVDDADTCVVGFFRDGGASRNKSSTFIDYIRLEYLE